MKVGKADSLAMHSINIWGLNGWIAKTREVAVSDIIGQHKDDVGLLPLWEARFCKGNRRGSYLTCDEL